MDYTIAIVKYYGMSINTDPSEQLYDIRGKGIWDFNKKINIHFMII
jgi:hypothetical protein